MIRIILLLIVAVSSLTSCSDKESKKYLPRASGKSGDLVIIMDSTQWNTPLGQEIKKVFRRAVVGLPQEEPMFSVVFVHPQASIKLLTQVRNLVYVFTLEKESGGSRFLQRRISDETKAKIKADTSFFQSIKRDEYARGQEVMYLFGENEAELIANLKQNSERIVDYFNVVERKRLQANLTSTKSTLGYTEMLRKEVKCELNFPIGYVLADKKDGFYWFRQIDANMDKDIFITWKPYKSEDQLLPDSIVAWRDEIAKKNLFENPENPMSFILTETEHADVDSRKMKLNKNFAVEVRGLWRTNNLSMGGSFLGYALVDEVNNRLVYIEGFTYAPGRNKREIMRELEAILWTFKL